MTAVTLDGVSLAYDGGRGVRGVTASIERGTTIALLGASGSGKSTLLRLIGGMLAPHAGVVRALGTDATALRGGEVRRHRARIGVLEQRGNLVDGLRVIDNVLMGRLGQWSTVRALISLVRPRFADVRDAEDALARVELASRLWSWPNALSGGERQRVALARLVVQQPELWLADEPVASLDPRLRRDVLCTMLALAREQRATVVVALHDLALLDAGFDTVWGLHEGRLQLCGPLQAVDRGEIEALYGAESP